MVTYTPEQPITHEIEVTFNGEQVPGSPYLCRVIDPSNAIREIPVQVKRSYKTFDLSTRISLKLNYQKKVFYFTLNVLPWEFLLINKLDFEKTKTT